MAEIDSKIQSEHDLARLANTKIVQDLFGSSEHFLKLYYSQVKCIEFGELPVPREHCLDTYNLILEFTNDARKWFTSIPSIRIDDVEATRFAGLLRHVPQNEQPAARRLADGGEKSSRFWYLVAAYDRIDQRIIKRIANRVESETKKRVHALEELTQEDKKDIGMLVNSIEDEFKDAPERILEFYILLFFDIYSIFRHYSNKFRSDEQIMQPLVIRRMCRFVLVLLPRIIGEYRFGDHNSDLKDLAFRNLFPELYFRTKKAIEAQLPDQAWRLEMETGLRRIVEDLQLGYSITKRQKGVYSAYQKSVKYDTPVEDLWDLFAFRVMINSDDTDYCYRILSKIQEIFKHWDDPRGYTDYIANPKDNGYQSLHVILESAAGSLVEVQIRTAKMNSLAEFGKASHQVYKTGPDVKQAAEATQTARKGRERLEQLLVEKGLTIDDFIDHVRFSLEHIPIEHYYEEIALGKYDPNAMIKKMLQDRMQT